MKTYKASRKMRKAIEKLENVYGKLSKDFKIEALKSNQIGRMFYDYCELSCNILQSNWTVNHEGEIF